jgi:hypothetical protein
MKSFSYTFKFISISKYLHLLNYYIFKMLLFCLDRLILTKVNIYNIYDSKLKDM